MQEIMDRDKYREDFVHMLTQQVALRAKMPHYVILFGTNFNQAVKYSRGSLLLVHMCKKYGLTMYEVPSIAISSVQKRLVEADFNPAKKADEEKMERLFKEIKV